MSMGNAGDSIDVRLLGTFRLTINGTAVQRFRAGKARNLFQYLVVRRDQVVLRDKLQQVLWPDSEGLPSSSLKVAVHALRAILRIRPDGTGENGVHILRQDFGYVLHADGIWIDVERFEQLAHEAAQAEQVGEQDAAYRRYTEAMELYRGDFLAGESQEWVVEHREWCRALALRVLDRLCAGAAERGDPDELIRWCRRMIELDPYCERAYQLLIDVHGQLGDLGAVRRWYDLCERRLCDYLDVGPSQETIAAYDRAMHGESRAFAGRGRAALRAVPDQQTGHEQRAPRVDVTGRAG